MSLLFSFQGYALTCAISIGYPPFQYEEKSNPAGLDVELIRLYNDVADEKIEIQPMKWDIAVSKLYYSKELDCVWGMEVSPQRTQKFLMTKPLYNRTSTLFIKKSSKDLSIANLKGQTIAGDKESSLELELRKSKIGSSLRIRQTNTKKESMEYLKNDKVFAVIVPYGLGMYFSKKWNLKLRPILIAKEATPIVVSMKKNNPQLLEKIQKNLDKIPIKKINEVFKKYELIPPKGIYSLTEVMN